MLRAMLKHMPRSNATYVRTDVRTDTDSPLSLNLAFGDNARAYGEIDGNGGNAGATRPARKAATLAEIEAWERANR